MGVWWLWKETFREIRFMLKVCACSPLFYKCFQLLPGIFLLLFLLLFLSLGLDFVLSLSFQFSFHHQVNRQNRMCVRVFPSDDTLSSLIAALHQSCADLHGEQFQEILAKDRCDFKNQLLWSFVLRILFGFPLLFWSY